MFALWVVVVVLVVARCADPVAVLHVDGAGLCAWPVALVADVPVVPVLVVVKWAYPFALVVSDAVCGNGAVCVKGASAVCAFE